MSQASKSPVIMWFRQDLRLRDNPALHAACARGWVLPIYILDDVNAGEHQMGAASRGWLHHALASLNESLAHRLRFYCGDATVLLPKIAEHHGASAVYWNRCYEPWRIARDGVLKIQLRASGIDVDTHNGSLLWEPWQVLKKDQTPYRVFTPYYRRGCLEADGPREPLPAPTIGDVPPADPDGQECTLEALQLLPTLNWAASLYKRWEISEDAAQERLEDFVANGLKDYREGRNYPDRPNVSRLSPYFHFGQLSPNAAWHKANKAAAYVGDHASLDTFLSELGWREFSSYLLYYFPHLPRSNLQSRFDRFPWREDPDALKAWQFGHTGYPLIDAGMHELLQTGYMHNRVRMVVGSFLVKNLLLHWHSGEAWFWDSLVDADLASNSASWQWVAGSGADAAPFFRIFNPVTQSEKFDPEGDYIRRYVPALARLPKKYIHAPWLAPSDVLAEFGVTLGTTYPTRIVDIKASRERALEAFAKIRS